MCRSFCVTEFWVVRHVQSVSVHTASVSRISEIDDAAKLKSCSQSFISQLYHIHLDLKASESTEIFDVVRKKYEKGKCLDNLQRRPAMIFAANITLMLM